MQGLALVDYDNLCPGNRSELEVEIRTAALFESLARASQAAFPGLRELDVRLYGGWIDEQGVHSPSARWLLPLLPVLRGRRQGLIVRPTLAMTMLQFPDVQRRGTVRLQARPRRQKMVDTMLGCDAVFAVGLGQSRVGIVSDDDGLLPAALSAHAANPAGTAWIRQREAGKGLNDRALNDRGIRIHGLKEGFFMTGVFKYWNERIRRDLASFGDPGASVDVEGSDRRFRASWTMRGESREATFSVSPDQGVWVTANGTSRVQYRTFVSGPDMADLRRVAQMIRSAQKPMRFIPTRAQSTTGSGPAIDVLSSLLDEEADTTRVMMVTGGAGAGKTCVLRELVRQQAEAYLSGRTSRLLLYVNAQGRALARLNEALATELQDLKVGLTYHSVAVLAQLGILVPVIDGFDELLGVSGYDDAFSSLAEFLEQLHGEGQILASARSTYYEEEFLERAGRATGDQTWSHESVRVLEWSDDDRRNYVDLCIQEGWPSADAEAFRGRVTSTFSGERHAALASRPLFFTRVVDLLQRGDPFSGSDDLLRTLVRTYSSRELQDKLLDRQSRPLLTDCQFENLMQELAEEMWNQETRGLDVASIRFVAEYFVHDAGLPEDAKQVIVERLPTMAFLGRHDASSAGGGIAFEHELFFYYFLARTITARLDAKGADIRVILGRSALPEEVADRAAQGASESGQAAGNRLRELLGRLSRAAETESRRAAQVRENAGLLVMALLRDQGGPDDHDIEDCTIRSVVFPGSHLRKVTLSRCTLIDVTLRRTDLTATRFVACDARGVRLYEPRVSRKSTRLELKGLGVDDVAGIRVPDGPDVSPDTNYDPAFIADTLRTCGAPIAGDPGPKGLTVPAAKLQVMERLMRVYRRTNLVCLQDGRLSSLFSDYHWPGVQQRLVENDIVKLEERATSGRPKQFLRSRFLPGQIMSGRIGRPDTDPRIRAFWEALAASAP